MTKWAEGVCKLIELTRANRIEWRKTTDTLSYSNFERENVVGLPYFTEFGNKHLALYEIRYKSFDDYDSPYWKHITLLEFVTNSGVLEMLWPPNAIKGDVDTLLELVRARTAGAKEFLDDLLAAEVPPAPRK